MSKIISIPIDELSALLRPGGQPDPEGFDAFLVYSVLLMDAAETGGVLDAPNGLEAFAEERCRELDSTPAFIFKSLFGLASRGLARTDSKHISFPRFGEHVRDVIAHRSEPAPQADNPDDAGQKTEAKAEAKARIQNKGKPPASEL